MAFIVYFMWMFNCTQPSDNNRTITIVQYPIILDGHMVGMMHCDWLFSIRYNIIKYK